MSDSNFNRCHSNRWLPLFQIHFLWEDFSCKVLLLCKAGLSDELITNTSIIYFKSYSIRGLQNTHVELCVLCVVQLQEVLLSYIANPQLELVLVMLIVPFIVNVSSWVELWQVSWLSLQPRWPQSSPSVVHHVLGGGQPDDEEVQDDEEPWWLLWGRLSKERWLSALVQQWGVTGEDEERLHGVSGWNDLPVTDLMNVNKRRTPSWLGVSDETKALSEELVSVFRFASVSGK